MVKDRLFAFDVFSGWISSLFLRIHQKYFHYDTDYVAQWVYAHSISVNYLSYHRSVFPVSRLCLDDLRVEKGNPPCSDWN